MWYDELFAPKTWIVNLVVATITAPIGIWVGIWIEKIRARRKHKRLAGLVGAYQLWQPTQQGDISTGTVSIYRQVNEVLYFKGQSAYSNQPIGAFSGTLIFPNSGTEHVSGSYKHDQGDLFGSLEGVTAGSWPSPDLLMTHNYVNEKGKFSIKTKWKRI